MLGGLVNNVTAQSSTINVVTTGVPFLRISPDARSGGMADAGIATSSDAYNSYWNIAKTPFSSNSASVGLTYTPWLQDLGLNDVDMISAAGFDKLDDQQGITGSIRYFSLGTIQFTDQGGAYTGQQFRPREFAIDGGYSRKLSDKLAIGIGLRFISSNLTGNTTINTVSYKTATAVAGDIHLYHDGLNESGEGFTYGITLTNLGSKISYTPDATDKDYIPANLGLGGAYTKVYDADNKITFTLNLNKLLVPAPPVATGNDTVDAAALTKYHTQSVVSSWFNSFSSQGGFKEQLDQIDISGGAEYWYQNQFSFRAGYFYENPNEGDRQYFTLGAGLKYNTFALDFSYLLPSGNGVTRDPLSNTLRFSLLFDLDKNDAAK
jgi:Type IX secretion system protein PorV